MTRAADVVEHANHISEKASAKFKYFAHANHSSSRWNDADSFDSRTKFTNEVYRSENN